MTEQLRSENVSAPQQPESDVIVLIRKIQQQLVFLEKKIDLLVSQSQEKPSHERSAHDKPFREKHFSKPYRAFGRPNRPGHYQDNKDRREGPAERSFHPGRHSEKRQGDDNRKKPFFQKRKDR